MNGKWYLLAANLIFFRPTKSANAQSLGNGDVDIEKTT